MDRQKLRNKLVAGILAGSGLVGSLSSCATTSDSEFGIIDFLFRDPGAGLPPSIGVRENQNPGYSSEYNAQNRETQTKLLPSRRDNEYFSGESNAQNKKEELVPNRKRKGNCLPTEGYIWTNPSNTRDLRTACVGKLYTFNKFVDINSDSRLEEEELFGLGKRVFSLNETISVGFYNKKYNGNVTFKTWDLSGNLIGTSSFYNKPKQLLNNFTEPGGPTQGGFLDNLRGAGPGNYKITATLENNLRRYKGKYTHSVDITITE